MCLRKRNHVKLSEKKLEDIVLNFEELKLNKNEDGRTSIIHRPFEI